MRSVVVLLCEKDVFELPGWYLRSAARRLRWPDGAVRHLHGARDLRRRGCAERMRHAGRLHTSDLRLFPRLVRRTSRRLRWSHAGLRRLLGARQLRRRRRSKRLRSRGLDLHPQDLYRLSGHLWPAAGWLRRPDQQLRNLHAATSLRWWRGRQQVRRRRRNLHAQDLHGLRGQMRTAARRVRRADGELRNLHGAADLRRRRRGEPVRWRSRELYAQDLRQLPRQDLWAGRGRLRRTDGQLRFVHSA